MDTVFNAWSLNFNLDILRKGGTMITVGVPCTTFSADFFRMLCREVSLKTRYLYTNEDFARAVRYVADREIDFTPLISKVFPMREIQDAFEYKATVPSLKVVLQNDIR